MFNFFNWLSNVYYNLYLPNIVLIDTYLPYTPILFDVFK